MWTSIVAAVLMLFMAVSLGTPAVFVPISVVTYFVKGERCPRLVMLGDVLRYFIVNPSAQPPYRPSMPRCTFVYQSPPIHLITQPTAPFVHPLTSN